MTAITDTDLAVVNLTVYSTAFRWRGDVTGDRIHTAVRQVLARAGSRSETEARPRSPGFGPVPSDAVCSFRCLD
jgi:hypothetical protein